MAGHRLLVLTILATITLASCAGSPPSYFYTLDALAEADGVPTGPPIAVSIERVTFPQWLDRAQIVTREAPNRLRIAEFHRWGGSLADDFSQVLAENLSVLLGTPRIQLQPADKRFDVDYQLHVDVVHFEGDLDADVVLDARWAIVVERSRDTLLIRRTAVSEALTRPDYDGLLAAKSRALLTLSREIAAAIQQLPP